MRLLLVCLLAITGTAAWAQSLKLQDPAPLQPGINQGTVDNFIGTHYWTFTGGPGHVKVHAQFTSMGVLGNAARSQVTITLSDVTNTWNTPKILSSDSKPADCDFDGDLKAPTKMLIAVAPPEGGLVRSGGDYQLQASGAVSFGQQSTSDPIIGAYNQMTGYTTMLGISKFLADGTVETASGIKGTWKLFDKDSKSYVIDIDGQDRQSLQLQPGRGLCDGNTIVFQQLK